MDVCGINDRIGCIRNGVMVGGVRFVLFFLFVFFFFIFFFFKQKTAYEF